MCLPVDFDARKRIRGRAPRGRVLGVAPWDGISGQVGALSGVCSLVSCRALNKKGRMARPLVTVRRYPGIRPSPGSSVTEVRFERQAVATNRGFRISPQHKWHPCGTSSISFSRGQTLDPKSDRTSEVYSFSSWKSGRHPTSYFPRIEIYRQASASGALLLSVFET